MVKPRPPRPTVQCVDTYCELYRDLFIEVRAYESFKYLQLGLISDLKRKSLPAIAKAVGLENAIMTTPFYKSITVASRIFGEKKIKNYPVHLRRKRNYSDYR